MGNEKGREILVGSNGIHGTEKRKDRPKGTRYRGE